MRHISLCFVIAFAGLVLALPCDAQYSNLPDTATLRSRVDSIMHSAVAARAFPGGQVMVFYRDELLGTDWVEGPAHFIESEREGTPYWFSKNPTTRIHIIVGSVDSEGQTNFEVIYTH